MPIDSRDGPAGYRAGLAIRFLSSVLPPFLTALAGIVLTIARDPQYFPHAQLYAEEGVIYYRQLYQDGLWAPLFGTYGGYLTVLPHLLADLASSSSLSNLPKVFAFEGIIVSVLPATMFSCRRYAPVVSSAVARAAIGLLWVVLPYSNELYANVTNSQWSFALCVLLVFVQPPKTKWWLAADLVIIVVGSLSGPFGIIIVASVLTVEISRWVRHFRVHGHVNFRDTLRREGLVSTLSNYGRYEFSLLVLLSGLQGIVILSTGARQTLPLGANLTNLVGLLAEQIGGPSLIGVASLRPSASLYPIDVRVLLATVPALILLVGYITGKTALRVLIVFGVLEYVLALHSPLVAVTGTEWATMTHLYAGGRYSDYPILAIYITEAHLGSRLVTYVKQLWPKSKLSVPRGVTKVRLLGLSSLVAVIAIAGLGIWDVMGPIGQDFHYSFPTHVGYQRAVRDFRRAKAGTVVLFPEYPPGWTMVLTKR